MKTVLVDMDNTIANHNERLFYDMKKHLPDDFDFSTIDTTPDGSNPKWIESIMDSIRLKPGWWESLEPIQKNLDFVYRLSEKNRIVIATKGPKSKPLAWAEKLLWCQRNLIFEFDIAVTTDKSFIAGDLLFDDAVSSVCGWIDRNKDGHVVFCGSNIKDRRLCGYTNKITDFNSKELFLYMRTLGFL